jgi:protein TonB
MASEPFPVAGGATAAVASEPVDLGGRLAVGCPERIPPTYPNLSRRIGEQGKVVLRVQLNERGLVTSVSVFASSGSRRLDEAALAAVRQWRCNPARRDGAPVPAVALQPIDFKLEER